MTTIKLFKSLADETRLRIFNVLIQYEFNVNELVQVMGMGQSRISRHLKILAESGLLRHRRDGSYVYYQAITNERTRKLVEFIQESGAVDPEFHADLQRAEQILEERKRRTQRFFASVAKHWDRIKEEVFGDFDLSSVIRGKTPSGQQVIVDLGCGTGELLLELLDTAQTVIGVDATPKMLEQARKRMNSHGSSIDLRLGELEHLPLKDQEADSAVINMVLHHLPTPALGIREASRILRPGGRFIIADFAKHNLESVRDKYGGPWLGFTKEEIEEWLSDAGFHLESMDSYDVLQGLRVQVFVAVRNEHFSVDNQDS